MDFPYIQITARDDSDGRSVVNLAVDENGFGVDQQALVDAVKAVMAATPGVKGVAATKFEMSVVTTEM